MDVPDPGLKQYVFDRIFTITDLSSGFRKRYKVLIGLEEKKGNHRSVHVRYEVSRYQIKAVPRTFDGITVRSGKLWPSYEHF